MGFFARNVAMAATAAMIAEAATIPIDTAKVRMQIQKVVEGEKPRYNGMVGTIRTVAMEEGPKALFSGLAPGLQRQLVFNGLAIGLYVPVRNVLFGDPAVTGHNPTLLQKAATGILTGTIGISIANPTDVTKVRMQAQGRLPLAERPYANSMDCYKQTISKEGLKGLWVGWGPNVLRNSVINASKLASYDQFKQICTQNFGLSDGKLTQSICAFMSGFVATCFGSPLDVMKTRLMNMPAGSSIPGLVSSMMKNEGPLAFYKGFVANFMRIGCWNICMFLTLEQIKSMFT